jgi:DNA-binding transcriptional MerR regulator
MVSTAPFTAADLHRITPVSRTQLTHWTRIGLLKPSVREAIGTGSPRLFSWEDVCVCGLLCLLTDGRMKPEWMDEVLGFVDERHEWASPPPRAASDRDRYLVMERVPDAMRIASETEAMKTLKSKGGVWAINLSALQRVLWGRIERITRKGATR